MKPTFEKWPDHREFWEHIDLLVDTDPLELRDIAYNLWVELATLHMEIQDGSTD